MVDVLWFVAAVGGCALLYWLGSRIEPHWVARDGRRMLVSAQLLDDDHQPVGRKFEARVVVLPDGLVAVARRRMFRRRQSGWWVAGTSPNPPRRRRVYLLRPRDPAIDEGLIALYLPTNSRAVPVLDELAGASGAGPS